MQPARSLTQHWAGLPAVCAVGCKRNRKGHQESWIGDQRPLAPLNGDRPGSAILTSASGPDSPGAIPLAPMTAARVTSLSDLMDSASDAPAIYAFSPDWGPVPILDPNPRGGAKGPRAPAPAERCKERTAAERGKSLLQERSGGRWVRVRGAAKGRCPRRVGVVARTATALFARWG